jgi:hypothetical protein
VCCRSELGENVDSARRNPGRFHLPAYIGKRGWFGIRLDRGRRWPRLQVDPVSPRPVAARLRSIASPLTRPLRAAHAPSGSGSARAVRPSLHPPRGFSMNTLTALLLWCLLFAVSWPLALLALVLWPVIWLLCLPLRIIGIGVGAVFALLKAVLFLPARLLGQRL